MTAKVLCLASAKGGSGKTLITASLATVLAALGKRVVMVDTDAATNGLSLLHLEAVTGNRAPDRVAPRGLFELEPGDPASLVEVAPRLRLLPATFAFRNTENVSVDAYAAALRSALRQLSDEADYIFLDAQAGSDEYAQQAVALADEVVIVSEYDPMSAAGVERLRALFGNTLGYGRTWILLNKMLPEFVDSFAEFLEIARYLSPIPWDADVVRSYARRSLAVDVENGSAHTTALIQTLRGLCGSDISDELAEWQERQRAAVREPAVRQVELVSRELDVLQLELWQLERRQRLRQALMVVGLLLVSVAALAALATWGNGTSPLVFPIVATVLGTATGLVALFQTGRATRPALEAQRLRRRIEALEERERALLTVVAADADGEGPNDTFLRPRKTVRRKLPNRNDRWVIPHDGGWAIARADRERISARFDTQAEAIARAREIISNAGGGELVVRGEDGRIRSKDSVSQGHGSTGAE